MNCKHYTGSVTGNICNAGVNYDDVTPDPKNRLGVIARRPCVPSIPSLNKGECNKFELPSANELEAEARLMARKMAEMSKLDELLAPLRRRAPVEEVVECYRCGNETLHLLVFKHGSRTVARAICTTENCVRVME